MSYPTIRLFVEFPLSQGATLSLEGDQAHYLIKVMRVKPDQPLQLFNGRDGEWLASVSSMAKKQVTLQLKKQLRGYLPPPDVWLCFAPIKFGRIDYLAQKATELGVAVLQPVITERTQVARVNLERLCANAIEAAEQCERVEVPEVKESLPLEQILADWPQERILFYGDETGSGQPAGDVMNQINPPKQWAVLIGPEGGFSQKEIAMLQQQTFTTAVGLGPRVMRADTAAMALLTLTQSAFGDWHIAPHYGQADGE